MPSMPLTRCHSRRRPRGLTHLPTPTPSAVPAIVQSVDVYLSFCSVVEGFGLPALEAMSCGRPTVLTDIGATRALDPAGAASLRIAPGDGEGLRAALRRLRADADLRRRLGLAGRRIAESFSEERTGRALAEVFAAELSRRQSAKRA